MADDQALTVTELNAMRLQAINDRIDRGIPPSHAELVFLYSRWAEDVDDEIRDTVHGTKNPHRAILRAAHVLLVALATKLAITTKKQAQLEARITELEAAVPKAKAKVRIKAIGVAA